jgi:hypothetical protein
MTVLTHVSRACDRTSIPDRAAAIIASAAFKDVGLFTKDSISRALDRSKFRNSDLIAYKSKPETKLHPCRENYARKDKTFVPGKVRAKFYHRTVTEECVLLHEPGSKYIGNFLVRH